MASKSKKNRKVAWAVRIILAFVLIAVLCVSLIWATDINRAMGLTVVAEDDFGGLGRDEALGKTESGSAVGNDLNVHFVDVGQGDACIVEFPDDKKMIIDGGKDSEKEKLLDYIDKNIRTSNNEKIKKFDYAVLTHPDEDHCGGLDDVLETYPADVFYRPNVLCTYKDYTDPAATAIASQEKYSEQNTRAYSRTLKAGYNETHKNGVNATVLLTDAGNDEISVIAPKNLAQDDPNYYSVTFYAPVEKYFKDVNDYSPILILEYHNKRVALSGDAEKSAETAFCNLVAAAKTDGKTDKYDVFTDAFSVNVVKLGHHGSESSTTKEYLETLTTPETAKNVLCVISCALVNSYGHPHAKTLNTLKELGFADENILMTSKNSNIALSIRAKEEGIAGAPTQYELYFGADMVRYEEPSLQAGNLKMQWQEIVYSLVVLIVLTLLIAPLAAAVRKKYKKAAAKARKGSKNS